ncbi:transporter substrate-binding domain-containing protein [Kordiimonas sp. SCSIO 12603]|uniref:substrate-binding periplasmic protein n=1 Tax=Kordiimonas sp. SCSIO 12603 TaxID=2829596 RepID=UPI002102086F|nr:transporter substrate-binding domain-containing protein [Kordiimonas sp. SCSIO 12603]UTW59954.1 transporter substrate-binding domain-containing protein [Kordiimonas sp. SCSIO 12603]
MQADEPQKQAEKDLNPVIMGYMNFPPLMEDVEGMPKGLMIDLVRKLALDQKLDVTFVHPPTTRLYQAIVLGEVHMWVGSPYTKPLQGNILYTEKPITKASLYLFARKGQIVPELNKLSGKPLIVLAGYQYGELLKRITGMHENMLVLPARNRATAFDLLEKGRADYFLDYRRPNLGVLGDYSTRAIQSFDIHLIVSKKAPQPELLLEKLERGLVNIGYQRHAE